MRHPKPHTLVQVRDMRTEFAHGDRAYLEGHFRRGPMRVLDQVGGVYLLEDSGGRWFEVSRGQMFTPSEVALRFCTDHAMREACGLQVISLN